MILDDALPDRSQCFGISEEGDRWLRCISVKDPRESTASSVYGGALSGWSLPALGPPEIKGVA